MKTMKKLFVMVGVLMVFFGASPPILAKVTFAQVPVPYAIDNSRYYISGYVGNSQGNTQYVKEIESFKFDFSDWAQHGLDFAVRIGDTPWAISAGYFVNEQFHKSDRWGQFSVDLFNVKQEQYRLGARWMHDFSERLSVYVGGGLANYNIHAGYYLNYIRGSSFPERLHSSYHNISQVGLYSEIAGLLSITDQLYTGIRLDYSFANARYNKRYYKLSAISCGVVAGIAF